MMQLTKYKLSDVAKVEISGVDKKIHEGETPVKLCNFTDVYNNWAITKDQEPNFMRASANDNEIRRFSLHKGQVAFTKDSETRYDIGIPTYIADDFDDVLLGYHCALITPNEDIALGAYINAFMHTSFIQKYFANNAGGSGQRYTLSVETMENMPLLLPSMENQIRIANLFSNIDRKIALCKAMNENLEAIARQLYDYWFVQFDFPDVNGNPYKLSGGKMYYNHSIKRNIPEGWDVKSINLLAQSTRGVTYSKSDLVEPSSNSILVLRGNNIENNKLVYDGNVAYIPKELVLEQQKIKKLDIIMTMSSGSKAHIGKCMMFNYDSPDTYGAFLNKFTASKEYAYLLFLHFTSNEFKHKIQTICNGTGINNLTNESFNQILLPIPDTSILNQFVSIVAPIFDNIGKNEQEILSQTKLRNELLPLLMNGQVSVN